MQYHSLTKQDKHRLFKQTKKCPICKGKSGTNRLVTDHCHTTGIVRGILCEKCNSWIGVIEGNRNRGTRIRYVQKLQKKHGIPPENFLFYLDDFRRAYIKSIFEQFNEPKQEIKKKEDVMFSAEI